jgi:hypothetical protein
MYIQTRLMRATVVLFSLMFLHAVSCNDDGGRRAFNMGFSPWLYDATLEAQDWVYGKLSSEGDIISHHMEEGVPWSEAYSGAEFSTEYRAEIQSRLDRKVAGQKVLLSISPLNGGRNGMALYRNDKINDPLPAPWNGYALNSVEIKTAYLNYAKRMIQYFSPDYLVLGVEVNLLIRNNKALWLAYVDLHKHVYAGLKSACPSLPVSVSVFCVPYFPEWSSEDSLEDQMNGLADINPHVDYLSFSAHPFMSALLAETFPEDYFRRLFALTDKPVAISESSYPAQVWSTLSAPILAFNGSQEKQDRFLDLMLEEAQNARAMFVIWFAIRDYDTLWSDTLGSSEAALVWRDTGLYDEAGNPRSARGTWMSWLAR